MSDRVKRRWIDFAITALAIWSVLIFSDLLSAVLMAAYGCWCFYDGLTRMQLSDKPKVKK